MRVKRQCYLVFLLMPCLAGRGWAQSDSLAVLTVQPVERGGYYPAFSNFCPDYVWLGEQIYQVASGHFLNADSRLPCLPVKALRKSYWSDPDYRSYLWWTADPYDARYYWTYEYVNDTLLL